MDPTPPQPQARECCDLVMKGGITSGVVYPQLIHQLSQRYQFKNIGGTSAGAIAAGACAAAEYGRQHGVDNAFDTLAKLPQELGEPVEPSKRSRLLSLFQPHPDLRRHFDVLLQALNKKPLPAFVGMLLRMLTANAGLLAVLLLGAAVLLAPLVLSLQPRPGVALSVLLALGALLLTGVAVWRSATAAGSALRLGVIWAVVLALLVWGLKLATGAAWGGALWVSGVSLLLGCALAWVLLLAAALARFTRSLLKGLHRNRYGLCSGQTTEEGQRAQLPGLTDWLTGYFDTLAGLTQRGHPLTFGDLWGSNDRKAPRNINLEVMTSAVSQQMVYSIPFRDASPYLYYDPDELKALFPERVMAWLNDTMARMAQQPDGDGAPRNAVATDAGGQARALLPFPRWADLPVVVAIRMSLSFPVLLSAVPLYAVDFSRTANHTRANGAALTATRVWFSDGGIGSNMPLHMFDALLPGHPTFAVNLKAEHPDYAIHTPETEADAGGRIYLPESRGGQLRHWTPPADATPLGGLAGFLMSIVNTMQNWRDEIQFPYPGFKDRIVQISQRPDEGGLNLDMPARNITALGNAGAMAAHRLIDRFHPAGTQAGAGWTHHQTVRLATFLGTMQPGSAALHATIQSGRWATLAERIGYTQAEMTVARKFLADVGSLGLPPPGEQASTSLDRAAHKPLAHIRITPRI